MQLTGTTTRSPLPAHRQSSMSRQFAGSVPRGSNQPSIYHLVAASGTNRQVSTASLHFLTGQRAWQRAQHPVIYLQQQKQFELSGSGHCVVPTWRRQLSVESRPTPVSAVDRTSPVSFASSCSSSSSWVRQLSLGSRNRWLKSNCPGQSSSSSSSSRIGEGNPWQACTSGRRVTSSHSVIAAGGPRCCQVANTCILGGSTVRCQAGNALLAGGGWSIEHRRHGASGRVRTRECSAMSNGELQKHGWEIAGITELQVIDGTVEIVGAEVDVLERLKQGFVQFKREKFDKDRDLFDRLAEKQEPKVMIVACSDSRVCPSLIMGLEPGEVFVIRNVANLVPPWEAEGVYHGTSAALEFAVTGLQVAHIIVVGHSSCGGIRALLSHDSGQPPTTDFINSWVQIGRKAYDRTKEVLGHRPVEEQCRFCEKESIKVSLTNLLTFPWVRERFDDSQLQLHGMYYDFVDGTLSTWEVKKDSQMVTDAPAAAASV